jgi:hypothetical protein
MRSWMYGMNSYYKKAAVYLEEAPWWVFAVDRIVEFLCDMTPPIPLPKIQKRLKKRDEIEFNDGNKLTTLRDWYGDLNQLFHCLVYMPIFYFCQKKIKCRSIDMDYDKAREIFYEKPKPNQRN